MVLTGEVVLDDPGSYYATVATILVAVVIAGIIEIRLLQTTWRSMRTPITWIDRVVIGGLVLFVCLGLYALLSIPAALADEPGWVTQPDTLNLVTWVCAVANVFLPLMAWVGQEIVGPALIPRPRRRDEDDD